MLAPNCYAVALRPDGSDPIHVQAALRLIDHLRADGAACFSQDDRFGFAPVWRHPTQAELDLREMIRTNTVPQHNPTPCHLCDSPAVAVYYFSHGCRCDPTTVQPLCEHHARKASPADGGVMEVIKLLTV